MNDQQILRHNTISFKKTSVFNVCFTGEVAIVSFMGASNEQIVRKSDIQVRDMCDWRIVRDFSIPEKVSAIDFFELGSNTFHLIGGQSGHIYILDAIGHPVSTITHHSVAIDSFIFTNDGRRASLLIGDESNTLSIWSVQLANNQIGFHLNTSLISQEFLNNKGALIFFGKIIIVVLENSVRRLLLPTVRYDTLYQSANSLMSAGRYSHLKEEYLFLILYNHISVKGVNTDGMLSEYCDLDFESGEPTVEGATNAVVQFFFCDYFTKDQETYIIFRVESSKLLMFSHRARTIIPLVLPQEITLANIVDLYFMNKLYAVLSNGERIEISLPRDKSRKIARPERCAYPFF